LADTDSNTLKEVHVMKELKELVSQVHYINGLRALCRQVVSSEINITVCYREGVSPITYKFQRNTLLHIFISFDMDGLEDFIDESWIKDYKQVKLLSERYLRGELYA
jgi:hypothetical protein